MSKHHLIGYIIFILSVIITTYIIVINAYDNIKERLYLIIEVIGIIAMICGLLIWIYCIINKGSLH